MPAPSLHPQSVLLGFQQPSEHRDLHVQRHLSEISSGIASFVQRWKGKARPLHLTLKG